MPAAATVLTVPVFSDLGNLALRLRREVFVQEQKVPVEEEFDAYDLTATHVVAICEGNLAGTLRLMFLAEHVKIGRVVVQQAFRGRGIANQMMGFAMDLGSARGETRFYLTAQTDKLGLYEKLGFVAYGEEFQDGGMPHFKMKTY